jgi:hypothetical protein
LAHRKWHLSLAATAAVVGLGVLVWPREAWAWGPLAHLDFSGAAIEQAHLLPQAVRMLLAKCSGEFLYGSLAADIVVGKNLARYAVHCHNWKVGWRVLHRARGEPQRAFAYGFLAHLAADTVAHNYFVPYKTVEGFPVRSTGHAYWELRFDQKLDPGLFQVARRITGASFRRHDRFLAEAIEDSCVIPFGVSRRLFGNILLAAKAKRWQSMSAVVAGERELPLADDEVAEARRLAVAAIVDTLAHGEDARSNGADPTGGRNLHLAFEQRQRLRRAQRIDAILPGQRRELLARTRAAFRAGIHGKVELPEIPVAPPGAPGDPDGFVAGALADDRLARNDDRLDAAFAGEAPPARNDDLPADGRVAGGTPGDGRAA